MIRYLVQRIGGASHGIDLETELPLDGARRGRALSAPPTASGTVSTPVARLIGPDGLPVIQKWRTAIFAVEDDTLRGGYVVTNNSWNGQAWDISMAGFTCYAVGQPFSGVKSYVEADPMDIFRDIWADLQSQPDGNIYLTLSTATSPVRVGKGPRDVAFTTGAGEDVAFAADDQARSLNWWSTFDCGREIDNLAAETPFDWREQHFWDDNAVGGIGHAIELGYPTLGGRRPDMRMVYGENFHTPLDVTDNPDYATDIIVLGAGEGKDRIRGYAGSERTGLRRTRVVEDRDIDTVSQANARATEVLGTSRDRFVVSTVILERHSNADIDALDPGDEVPLYAETESGLTIDQWVKVVDIQAEDAQPDQITVTVTTT